MDDEITRARRKRIARTRTRRTAWFLLALLLVAAAVLLANALTAATFKDIGDFFTTAFASSDGYPVMFEGSMPIEVRQLSGAYAVLSEDALSVYGRSGALLLDVPHGYDAAHITASGNRIALFNVGGRDITVYNRSKQIASIKADYPVVSADLASDGSLAVLTRSELHTCELSVYKNGSYERTVTWQSTGGFPLFTVAQRGGSNAAVVCVGEDSAGRVISRVTAVNTSKKDVAFEGRTNGLPLLAAYRSDGTVLLVTDEHAVVFAPDGSVASSYEYGTLPLLYASCDTGGAVALAFGDNSQKEINSLVALDSKLNVEFSLAGCGAVEDIYISNSSVLVLGDSRVRSYSMTGELKKSYEAAADALALVEFSGPIAILPDSAARLFELKLA